MKSGLYPANVPDESVTSKTKVSEESAASPGKLAGVVFALKQKKFPLPLHPDEFKPPSCSINVKAGVIMTALAKLLGRLNAIPFTPERPFSVSAAALIPVIRSVNSLVVAFSDVAVNE